MLIGAILTDNETCRVVYQLACSITNYLAKVRLPAADFLNFMDGRIVLPLRELKGSGNAHSSSAHARLFSLENCPRPCSLNDEMTAGQVAR